MDPDRRRRTRAAMDAVVCDDDVVALILSQGVGPASFAAASLVCRAWLRLCRFDERVLRGAALYQGGLTKGAFMKLFAITSKEADASPHSTHKRYGGGVYFLYSNSAVEAVLAAGGMREWRRRMRFRGQHSCIVGFFSQPDSFRRLAWREEQLHARAVQMREWKLIRARPCAVSH